MSIMAKITCASLNDAEAAHSPLLFAALCPDAAIDMMPRLALSFGWTTTQFHCTILRPCLPCRLKAQHTTADDPSVVRKLLGSW